MARHPLGTIPKLTEKLIEDMTLAVSHGAYLETASALCGISKDTLYRWLRLAESNDATELLKKLSYAVKKAMAEAEIRDLAVIDKAAQSGEWTAAAWRLERKHPERWGRQARVQVEHSGPNGNPIELVNRTESLKRILADPEALKALEAIEAKIINEDDEQSD